MPTRPETAEFLLDQLREAGDVSVRRMFGNYALYCDGLVVGLICNDQLFIKKSSTSGGFLDDSHTAPPFPGAKNFLRVPDERWDDPKWLSEFVLATAAAVPPRRSR